MKFLVVDDVAIIRRLICQTIRSLDYDDIVEAADGIDALERTERERFDVILADWSMPNLNGLALLRELRERDGYRDVPIIMVTSNSLVGQIREAIQADVSDYIVKPFSLDVLRSKIQQAVRRRSGEAHPREDETQDGELRPSGA